MDMTLNNGFCEMSQDEIFWLDGGVKIFGASLGGIACGALSGAAVGSTIGGPIGFGVGALVGCGVTYLYDSFQEVQNEKI